MSISQWNHDDLRQCRRINVIGTSGSGKSTFARQLADLLNLPHIEMDRLFWQPDWQETADPEFFEKVKEVTDRDAWILDGNYTRTAPLKWERVELVIWLDMSFLRTLYRVTRRVFQRSLSRQEIWPGTGNRETFAKAFCSRDSIILWMLTSYRSNRKKYIEVMNSMECEPIRFVQLRSPGEVQDFLDLMTG